MNYSVAPLVLDDLDEIYAYVEDIEDENGALEKERAEIKVPELTPGQWWWD